MNYLDNAATTLVKPRAVGEAVHRALTGAAGYARGGYAAAQRAGDLVYDCRSACTTRRASYLRRTPRTRLTSPSMRSQGRG